MYEEMDYFYINYRKKNMPIDFSELFFKPVVLHNSIEALERINIIGRIRKYCFCYLNNDSEYDKFDESGVWELPVSEFENTFGHLDNESKAWLVQKMGTVDDNHIDDYSNYSTNENRYAHGRFSIFSIPKKPIVLSYISKIPKRSLRDFCIEHIAEYGINWYEYEYEEEYECFDEDEYLDEDKQLDEVEYENEVEVEDDEWYKYSYLHENMEEYKQGYENTVFSKELFLDVIFDCFNATDYEKYCVYRFLIHSFHIGIISNQVLPIYENKRSKKAVAGKINLDDWEKESFYKKNGYSVAKEANLSSEERKRILYRIIIDNAIPKSAIIKFLETMILLRKNMKQYDEAVKKWKDDLAYIKNL